MCTDAAAAAAAAVCFCFCRIILANYFVRLSATVLDAKIYNKQRIQANSVCIYHRVCHSVAARLPLRCALVHQCLQWVHLRCVGFRQMKFRLLCSAWLNHALLTKATIQKHANQNIAIKKIVLKFTFCLEDAAWSKSQNRKSWCHLKFLLNLNPESLRCIQLHRIRRLRLIVMIFDVVLDHVSNWAIYKQNWKPSVRYVLWCVHDDYRCHHL